MTASKEPGFVPIKPAAVDLTAAAGGKDPKRRRGTGQQLPDRQLLTRPWLWLGGGALLCVVSIVFLLLPRWLPSPVIEAPIIENPTIESGSAARQGEPVVPALRADQATRQTPPPAAGAPATADTPWSRAQQFSVRKDSQALLQELLDAQKTLEERGVTLWGKREYARALEHAQAGDAGYSRQNFAQAHDHYAAALDILSGLLEGIEQLFADSMAAGNAALAAGAADAAGAAFNVALAIDPIDRDALLGLERTQNLPQVMALLEQGDALLRDVKPEQARDAYQQALEVDAHSLRARQQLDLTKARINDDAFNLAMSSGFRLLEQQRHAPARAAFARALKLKPRSRAARDGIEQATQRITSTQVNAALKQARDAAQQEDWQGAIASYNAALKLNSSLGNALEGKQRATLRAEVHSRLEELLAQPERLFDEAVYNDALSFLDTIRALPEPGPILSAQLHRLTHMLTLAATPVSVELHSDNLTRVTLYKVGELGAFASKVLSLRPGHYVAVGRRDGYRDVRVEFFADPDNAMQPVLVSSSERIALGD